MTFKQYILNLHETDDPRGDFICDCFEQGKALPSLLNAIALADMFDVSLDYLVGRCDNSKAHKTKKVWRYREG